ncbi:MAG: hypothetical protein ACKVIN_00475 [Longimicrobiales bacterium]|jgi:hypothetical protein
MAQCQGKTKKGEQCRRDASGSGSYCTIHLDQEIRARPEPTGDWDKDAIMKAAIGFAIVGAIFLFRFRR